MTKELRYRQRILKILAIFLKFVSDNPSDNATEEDKTFFSQNHPLLLFWCFSSSENFEKKII